MEWVYPNPLKVANITEKKGEAPIPGSPYIVQHGARLRIAMQATLDVPRVSTYDTLSRVRVEEWLFPSQWWSLLIISLSPSPLSLFLSFSLSVSQQELRDLSVSLLPDSPL